MRAQRWSMQSTSSACVQQTSSRTAPAGQQLVPQVLGCLPIPMGAPLVMVGMGAAIPVGLPALAEQAHQRVGRVHGPVPRALRRGPGCAPSLCQPICSPLVLHSSGACQECAAPLQQDACSCTCSTAEANALLPPQTKMQALLTTGHASWVLRLTVTHCSCSCMRSVVAYLLSCDQAGRQAGRQASLHGGDRVQVHVIHDVPHIKHGLQAPGPALPCWA